MNYNIYLNIYYQQDAKSYKFSWTEQELIQFLKAKSDECESNLENHDETDDKRYDGLVFILSCHAIEGNNKTAIHRIFSGK